MKTKVIGVFSGAPAFDGNRPTKSTLPIGSNLGTATIAEFLEAAFFALVKATISINSAISYFEKGIPQNIGISGVVTANDEILFANARVSRSTGADLPFAATSGAYAVTDSGQALDTDYSAKIDTGSSGNLVSATKQVRFIYPFLNGMNANVLDGDSLYSAGLTKTVTPKANRTATINGSNQYIYYAYPASYGALNNIKDQNGFNVTNSFALEQMQLIAMAGGETCLYNVYRTSIPTTVVNAVFQFNF